MHLSIWGLGDAGCSKKVAVEYSIDDNSTP